MARHHFGWRKQPRDDRDWQYVVPRRITDSLPLAGNLSANMPENLDQSSLGGCGNNTEDECWMFDQKVEGLPVVSMSRLFGYYVTRMLMGTVGEDSGVDNRSMLKSAAQTGRCVESLWPYDISQFAAKPPQACFDAASQNKITNYAAVAVTLPQMQGTIITGRPFIFGFDAFQGILSDQAALTGDVPMPAAGETPVGGHDVSIYGYSVPDQMFLFRNHWTNADGSWWGRGGNGRLPFAYCLKYGSDPWVINAVPGSVPAPPAPKPSAIILTMSGTLTAGRYTLTPQ